jgi:hypothetical protein
MAKIRPNRPRMKDRILLSRRGLDGGCGEDGEAGRVREPLKKAIFTLKQ